MKKCITCGKPVTNPTYDYCYGCFSKKEKREKATPLKEDFEDNLDFNEIHTAYIMFYGRKEYKIGYTKDLNSRMLEIKREYPNNKLVYFREFVKETTARRFEAWLKTLSDRELHKFIIGFQDKIKKVDIAV